MILALDPGKTFGWVWYDPATHSVLASGHGDWNEVLLTVFQRCRQPLTLALEWPDAYGSLPQADLYNTLFDAGQLVHGLGMEAQKVHRRDVKKHLLGRVSGTDAHLRAALVAEFGEGSDQTAKRCGGCKGAGDVRHAATMTCGLCDGSGKVAGKRAGTERKCPACRATGSTSAAERLPCGECGGSGRVGTDGALSTLSGSHEWAAMAVAVCFAAQEASDGKSDT